MRRTRVSYFLALGMILCIAGALSGVLEVKLHSELIQGTPALLSFLGFLIAALILFQS